MKRSLVLTLLVTALVLVSCGPDPVELLSGCKGDNLSSYDSCVRQKAETYGTRICKVVDIGLRDECYLHAAVGKDDASICEDIYEDRVKFNCYGSLAIYNDRLEIISSIEDKDRRNEWYITMALRKNESDICRNILDDEDAHGACFYQLVKRLPNPDLCYFIDTNTIHKDACYYHIASILENRSYCVGITSVKLKQRCDVEDWR